MHKSDNENITGGICNVVFCVHFYFYFMQMRCTGKLSVLSFTDDTVTFLRDLPSLARGLQGDNHGQFVERV